MKTSQKGIDLIKSFEALVLKSYLCPAGKLTIGYGHTKDVVAGTRITEPQAEEFLREDLEESEQYVSKYVKRKLTQYQFDALVSFVFNCGVGNFLKSTLLKKVKINSNDQSIAIEFSKWIHADGKPLEGLRRRRKAEAELYFTKEQDEEL
jgi:lysozyme